MTAVTVPSHHWSTRRWVTTTVVVLAGQLLLIFLLSRMPSPSSTLEPRQRRLKLMTDRVPASLAEQPPWVSDPANFALVSPRGFSGPVWRRFKRFDSQAGDWSEPPRWLTPEAARFGAATDRDAVADRPSVWAVADKPPSTWEAGPAPVLGTLTNSLVRLEGPLAKRGLVTPLPAPQWAFTDVLVPSRIQVVVGADGVVQSATLLPFGSGLPAADRRALDLARAARFTPLESPPRDPVRTWGTLVFRWRVVEPTAALPAGTAVPLP